jgi:uncharacterized protein with ParB-like and HNH nuclease domain
MTAIEQDELQIEKEEDKAEEVLIEYDIATYPSDNTLSVLVEMWKNGDITIPDFQRGFVWTIEQSTLLIESFLIGLPVPPVFFYIDKENKNLVVDGQQRILSIVYFFEGLFGPENEKGRRQIFRLTGLNVNSPFYNKTCSDLDPIVRRKLEGSVLRAINIRQLSPKEQNTSIYHIFERLNTGGTPLTSQEIRNVVFRGFFIQELKKLNLDTNWRKIIGKKTPDKHQKDIELVLRAYAIANNLETYEKPMKEFLNKAISYVNKKPSFSKEVVKFINDFPRATAIIEKSLKSKPFNVRGPLSTSAFDSIFCAIINNLDRIPADLRTRYDHLLTDPDFITYTSLGTTDARTVKERYKIVKKILID